MEELEDVLVYPRLHWSTEDDIEYRYLLETAICIQNVKNRFNIYPYKSIGGWMHTFKAAMVQNKFFIASFSVSNPFLIGSTGRTRRAVLQGGCLLSLAFHNV